MKATYPLIDQLKAHRKEKKLSQIALEDISGYSATQISYWETGYRYPKIHQFVDWANALGYEVVLRKK